MIQGNVAASTSPQLRDDAPSLFKKFPCLSSSPMFHDRSNREQPGDHVNYNVGDIQPVPCV